MEIHRMLIGAAGLLLATASWGYSQQVAESGSDVSRPTGDQEIRTIWSGTDLDLEGQVSRDGRMILFEDNVTGDLMVRHLETGEARPIIRSHDPRESAGTAEFSEDGSQVVYSWQKADGTLELWIAGVDGSYPRMIYKPTDDVGYIEPERWSADGRYVLARLQTQEQTHRIAWIPVDGGPIRVLKTLNWGYPSVRVSPNGRWIAYDFPPVEDESEEDIFLLAADGSREIHLVEHPEDDDVIAWLPDSRGLLIRSDRRGAGDDAFLVRIDEDGKAQGVLQLVKEGIGDITGRGISQDGTLYYEGETEDSQQVYVAEMNPETGELLDDPIPATERFLGHTISPAWSPDGTRLAMYVSGRGSQPEGPRSRTLIVRNVETGEEQDFVLPVHGLRGRGLGLRWSPDGKSILMRARDFGEDQGPGHLARLDVETGEVTALVRRDPGVFFGLGAMLSPDGKKLYFLTAEGPPFVTRILERALETGAERELVSSEAPNEMSAVTALSPDGSQVAFLTPFTYGSSTLTTLQVVSTKGGEVREVFRLRAEGRERLAPRVLTWTTDSRYLLFGIDTPTGPTERPMTRVWRILVDGGDPQALDIEIERPVDFQLHPDGRRVAFTARREIEVLRSMTGFLPELQAARE